MTDRYPAKNATTQGLLESTLPWLNVISDAAPAGGAATFDPDYEAVRDEVAKLEKPAGGPVDWGLVIRKGGNVLSAKSKDLLIASYVVYALHQTQGYGGLAAGLELLAELIETFWDGLFPPLKRMRGRVNALTWLLERLEHDLADAAPLPEDRDTVEALCEAVGVLAAEVDRKFEDSAPPLRPLKDVAERLRHAVPRTAPRAPASQAPAPPVPPPAARIPVSPPPDVPQPAAPTQASPTQAPLTDTAAAMKHLRTLSAELIKVGHALQRTAPEDPTGYRVLRAGCWLVTMEVPPLGADGNTRVPGLPEALRARVRTLRSNARWTELLQVCEGALPQNRLCLDLQHGTTQALAGLGHEQARCTVVEEVRTLLQRLPELPRLHCANGTPTADAQTLAWLEDAVLGTAAQAGAAVRCARPPTDGGCGKLTTRLAELVDAGAHDQALDLAQQAVAEAHDGRARFEARLLLAELCVRIDAVPVARALYTALDLEMERMGLHAWEPALALRCLSAHIACLRAAAGTGQDHSAKMEELHVRLAQTDPAAAVRMIARSGAGSAGES